jgi:hypothetical protein
MVWDVLGGPVSAVQVGGSDSGSWDVVLDKGTFDAVSLSGASDAQGRRVSEGYRDRVLQLLRSGGMFLVTSCNWTEAELRQWFEESGQDSTSSRLVHAGRVEYRSFSFGGVKGQTISTSAFLKT